VWTIPLKSKSALEVTKGMQQVLSTDVVRINGTLKNLQTDHGTEFFNKYFSNLMHTNRINHYNTFSTKKCSICERVIRTLKECLYRSFSLRGTYKWIDNLENITKDYNNRKHRTIGMKPNEVNEKNQQFILNSCFNYSE